MLKGILLLIAVVILFAAGFRKMEDVDFFRYAVMQNKRGRKIRNKKNARDRKHRPPMV